MDWNSIFSLFGPNGAQAAPSPFNFENSGMGGFMSPAAGANFPPAANLPDLTQGGAAVTTPGNLGIPQIMAQVFQNHGLTPGQVTANPQAAADTVRQAGASGVGGSTSGSPTGTVTSPWDFSQENTPNQTTGPIPPGWQSSPEAASSQIFNQAFGGTEIGRRLQEMLKGVTAPKPPQPQTLHPAVPPRAGGSIQPSHLLAFLTALGAGGRPGQVPALGSVIGGR